ncbi:acyl carrier protein [Actinacidiphila sp. ITFR-21]|uniref:acyl carrier protein n=1 Tax=Actinacidiphila sp. ITFR-21 TaxID=3075199 RepID=UPI00288A7064|nr:phosphopantetheine-binding protein [Streptomyces sp. ITFR-21]WNI14378.1 phosphopantetheine-binding protein [Streptomyces sp. ITFR-21]
MENLSVGALAQLMRECLPHTRSLPAAGDDLLDSSFRELGFDSLAMVQFAEALQNRLRVPIPDPDLDRIATPRDVLDYVHAHPAGYRETGR